MRNNVTWATMLLFTVLGLGCSSARDPVGRYVPMREYGNWILDTQTGAIYAPTPGGGYYAWSIIRLA